MPLTDYLSDFSEELLYVFVSLIKPNHLTQASRTVGEGLADVISMHESLTNQILLFHFEMVATPYAELILAQF